jgi:beta-1,4-mannooligosaccharide/beta-1,4-mannosyl-N-acetylglucosamine phosphorylase
MPMIIWFDEPHGPLMQASLTSKETGMHREFKTPNPYMELFRRHAANPILTARDWPYPAHTVFNAGACQVGDETVLLVRVEDRRGHSHLTVARSIDGVSNWHIDSKPSFAPDPANYSEEAWGVEDARLTWVEDRSQWIIAYTAYSPSGPLVSLAETKERIQSGLGHRPTLRSAKIP